MLRENLHKPFIVVLICYFCFLMVIAGINVPFALLLLFAAICYLFSFRIKLKGFGLILFISAFIVRLMFVLTLNTPPISDFKIILDSAVQFARGDYSFNLQSYFFEWAYQTGFVIYEGIVARLTGVEYLELSLKILNALFSSGICLLVYLISRSFASEVVSRFGSLLTIWAVFPATFVTVLSNQHIAALFILLALYLLMDKKSLRLHSFSRCLLAGLSLALSNIMRPETIIIIGALIVFSLIQIFRQRKEARKFTVIKVISALTVYLLVNILASRMIIDKGINKEGLRNNNPLWKFVVGLNFDTSGSYSKQDSSLVFESKLTSEERKNLELSLIKERLRKDPGTLLSLFVSKFQFLWGRNPMFWSFLHLLESDISVKVFMTEIPIDRIVDLVWGVHNLQILLLVAFGLICGIFSLRADSNPHIMIFYLILLISAAIYTFTEVQERYLYLQQTILYIPAIAGIEGFKTQVLSRFKYIKSSNPGD